MYFSCHKNFHQKPKDMTPHQHVLKCCSYKIDQLHALQQFWETKGHSKTISTKIFIMIVIVLFSQKSWHSIIAVNSLEAGHFTPALDRRKINRCFWVMIFLLLDETFLSCWEGSPSPPSKHQMREYPLEERYSISLNQLRELVIYEKLYWSCFDDTSWPNTSLTSLPMGPLSQEPDSGGKWWKAALSLNPTELVWDDLEGM